jgi:UDP-N-acetylglucosamine--N-acetylmuramyl-(pentapeptide) pyrophosphoryl-undecaprenol N-acetylglucosamine transferase
LRVVIAGGGTGGHLFPGLAVARALKARVPSSQISFAGTATGIEARVIPTSEFELDVIRSGGLKGKSIGALVRGLVLLPLSALDAWRLISRRRPDVVIGVGGYSSGPVIGIAVARGIPALLMEQNAQPGITNRLLAPFVQSAAVTYEASLQYFGKKGFLSGNPIRQEFLHVDDRAVHAANVGVLIVGGSQGAHAINVAVAEAAPRLARAGDAQAISVVCQTGVRDFELVHEAFQRSGVQGRVERFIDAMDREMKAAGLIVSRAGATTLAEITAAGRPSILIPLPTAADDHQRKNAEALRAAGAAEVIEQADLTGDVLADRILALAADREMRQRMSVGARRLAKPDAAERIVDAVVKLGGLAGLAGRRTS